MRGRLVGGADPRGRPGVGPRTLGGDGGAGGDSDPAEVAASNGDWGAVGLGGLRPSPNLRSSPD